MTPQQRDRQARAVTAIARACGFGQAVAPLILRRVPDVDKLLRSDDATLRRVLGDPALRGKLRAGLADGFREHWKQATLERIRSDHEDWLRAWWLPVLTATEFDRLLRTPTPRGDHRRVGIARPAYPATAGAVEITVETTHRSEVGPYLLVERRIAAAVLDLAHEVAREDDLDPSGPVVGADTIDDPPPGVDHREYPHVAWWHGGRPA
ncbi:MAG: hypothetical protein WEB03_04790 [Nitriliruptor sp.]|uniref:hypothetical protein n=1 Tax=Nitriliruptor sp. TaxID=2448056 RepID=UPI00349FEA88